MTRIAIIGSTGSIGTQTLSVIQSEYAHFRVVALATDKNDALISEQAMRFGAKIACCYDREAASRLRARTRGMEVLSGEEGLMEIVAQDLDMIVVAGNGTAMIGPTLSALSRDIKIALATKEVIVCAGHLLDPELVDRYIIPVDSEPSAIFQSLQGEDKNRVKEILLTASGGPFFSRDMTWGQLFHVTPEDALNHPRWRMGRKISVDSATLVNKGLELIEVSKLFGIGPERIRILLHPQAEIHSGVVMIDGSSKFQASPPDMRYPISYALHHPARAMSDLPSLKFPVSWTMADMPEQCGRTIELAKLALSKGPVGLVAYAASDEMAVQMFLSKSLPFNFIPEVIAKSLGGAASNDLSSPQKIVGYYNQVKKNAFEIGRRLCQF